MQIGPYEILDEIGRGGMGTVYRALQPSVNRIVALKVLSPQLEEDATFVKRFRHEALTAAKLTHQNIVHIWDASVNNPPYYIAMELLSEETLAGRLTRGPLTLEEAASIIRQLCPALDYAGSQGVIHRDIKPDNIMFDTHGKPVLTDFGIAKADRQTILTNAGAKLGTPDYMSPEQAKGQKLDWRSDLYSLTVVFYESIAGRPPFFNKEPLVTMRQIANERPPSPRIYQPGLPEDIESFLQKALAKNREERFQSGVELSQALQILTEPGLPLPDAAAVAKTAHQYTPPPEGFQSGERPAPSAPTGLSAPKDPRLWYAILVCLMAVFLLCAVFLPAAKPVFLFAAAFSAVGMMALYIRAKKNNVPDVSATPAQGPLAWLQVHEPGSSPRNTPLYSGQIILGRDPSCDMAIADPSVSSRHALISTDNGIFQIKDLGSTNGTWVNGVRIDLAALKTRDELLLGDTIIYFFPHQAMWSRDVADGSC